MSPFPPFFSKHYTYNVYLGDEAYLEIHDANSLAASGTGENAPHLSQRYLYGAAVDEILAVETYPLSGAGNVLWGLADHEGTVRDVIDNLANLVTHRKYDSFGNLKSGTIDNSFVFGYTGRPLDGATGLYNYRERWYGPSIGRFWSEDPALSTWNLYVYCGNNPVNLTDPTGLCSQSWNGTGSWFMNTNSGNPYDWDNASYGNSVITLGQGAFTQSTSRHATLSDIASVSSGSVLTGLGNSIYNAASTVVNDIGNTISSVASGVSNMVNSAATLISGVASNISKSATSLPSTTAEYNVFQSDHSIYYKDFNDSPASWRLTQPANPNNIVYGPDTWFEFKPFIPSEPSVSTDLAMASITYAGIAASYNAPTVASGVYNFGKAVVKEAFDYLFQETTGIPLPVNYVVRPGKVPGGTSRTVQQVAGHHPWPQYLQGPAKQALEDLPADLHNAYHGGLDKLLPRRYGIEYYRQLSPAKQAENFEALRKYTQAFDQHHGTKMWDAIKRTAAALPGGG